MSDSTDHEEVPRHPIVAQAVRSLAETGPEQLNIGQAELEQIAVAIHDLDDPSVLADIGSELLHIAYFLDQERASPKAADAVTRLANGAAKLAIARKKDIVGAVDGALDRGEVASRFLGETTPKCVIPKEDTSGKTVRIDDVVKRPRRA